ncbi:autotransporter outer membrane beta-barrel domain-containing protein, partial [Brucella pseudogrignonensis]
MPICILFFREDFMNISLFRRRLPKRALFGTVSLLALTVASVGVSTPEAFADAYINHGDTKTVSGDAPDSPWDVPGALFIGDNEDGTLNIINGGTVTSVSGYVGISFSGGPDLTGEGTVTVDGAGSTWTNFSLDIDNGSVSVTNGGTIVTNGMLSLIGMHAGKSGLVRVDGPGSTWTSLDLTVGERGAGQLLISNGGIVQSSGFGVIGNLAGSVGAVIVTGADSLWANDGYTFVGNNGSGLLSIGDGGRVVNNDAVVGRLAGSDGTVTVEGNGSSWTNNGGLTIGNLSTGEMIIREGGKVTNSDGFIGRLDGATGSVYVTGADSTWSNSGDLSIGKAGHGELTISDGGTVSANSVHLGGENTGQAVLNIGSQAGDIASAPGRLEANSVVLSETGTSHLVFNHNDLTGDYDFSAVISGGGSPDSSVDVLNGNTVMTGVGSDYAAPTNIEGGILSAGGSSVFSARSDYTVSPAGGLDLRGYDQSIASLINDGSVDFGGTGGTTLHVIGNYSGNGAVTINSVLGGDDSKTDLLQVDGDTSGATKLNVINRDGTGASTVNGIKVVDVGGNSEGSFALGNGYTTKDGLQAVVG